MNTPNGEQPFADMRITDFGLTGIGREAVLGCSEHRSEHREALAQATDSSLSRR